MSEPRFPGMLVDKDGHKIDQPTAVEQAVVGHFRRLEGRLKTLEEAIALDAQQAKGRKDVVGMLLWMQVEDLITELTDILAVE